MCVQLSCVLHGEAFRKPQMSPGSEAMQDPIKGHGWIPVSKSKRMLYGAFW